MRGMILVLRCFSAPDEKVKISAFIPYSYGPDRETTYILPGILLHFCYELYKAPAVYLESKIPEFDVCWDNRIPAGTWNIMLPEEIENDI